MRALRRLARRPFGRFNSWFYEFEAATAVGEIVGPVVAERISNHPAFGERSDLPILDIGAGGGQVASYVAEVTSRPVLAVEPSPNGFAYLQRRVTSQIRPLSGAAESLPTPDDSCAAVYSSCTVKHWRDLDAGLAECIRVTAPGGLVLTIEIDGDDADELRAFALRTRIPDALAGLYVRTIGRGFAELERSPDEVAERLVTLGARDIEHGRIPDLPFWIVSATAPD